MPNPPPIKCTVQAWALSLGDDLLRFCKHVEEQRAKGDPKYQEHMTVDEWFRLFLDMEHPKS
jgi:hypothetical protein